MSHAAFFDTLKAAGPSRADAMRRMDAVAHILDTAFVLPGTRQRIGIDAIIGLVPGIGDAITTLLSSYVIWEARQLGLPRHVIARMLGNLAIHGVVGSLPLVGDVFDALFRVNRRNMRIVRSYLERETRAGVAEGRVGPGRGGDGRAGVIDAEYRVIGERR